ncbi:Cyanophycin synthetase [compost metagenome]
MNFLLEQTLPIAERLGLGVRILTDPAPALELRYPNGEVRHLYHCWPDINPAAAARAAAMKAWSLHFLKEAGVSVPDFACFGKQAWAEAHMPGRDEAAAIAYAETLGFPVVLKPCTLSYSQGVHLVASAEEMRRRLPEVTAQDPMFLVQRYVRGREYRVVVLDGRIELVFEKSPVKVRGDGLRTLGSLLESHLAALRAQGHEAEITAEDSRFDSFLGASGRTRADVPARGEEVQLSLAAGLISGGEVAEADSFPGELHGEMLAIAREAGLRYAGIDVILNAEGPHLIEINAYPGNGGYAALSAESLTRVQELTARLVEAMRRPA